MRVPAGRREQNRVLNIFFALRGQVFRKPFDNPHVGRILEATMEIYNHGNNPRDRFQINNSSPKPENVENGKEVDRSDEVKPSRLLERLEGDMNVRERLLVEIQAKVQAGEYSTRAAAESAAQNIVD
jgi:hypothetical protein